ncbi:unnamed protein product [Medioppia subpectinata]|uniref:Chitosanase n=1 Tax=Medioppia subpectinata TaxID=1979941 RepID=A0A7R9Q3E7_9ACAR|nr:unnamed protein product [Medioppia subpectinata]CAG2110375.1 unnamed protein product [Medioppia subpectinata]
MSANGLSPEQKLRCERIISVFESDTIEIKYTECEDIVDGRGYTCSKFGFTTATGDAYEVVKQYTGKKPVNPLAEYLPELKRLAEEFSNDTTGLTGFPDAWNLSATSDRVFNETQDEVSAAMSYNPAMKLADVAHFKSALGKCALYDCIIQHGNGNDGDGLPAIFNRTVMKEGGVVTDNEGKWIRAFLDMRQDDFKHPHDPINIDHRDKWPEHSERVDAFMDILNAANMDLNGPIHVTTGHHDMIVP